MAHRIISLRCSIQAVVPDQEISPEPPSPGRDVLATRCIRSLPEQAFLDASSGNTTVSGRRMDMGMGRLELGSSGTQFIPVDTKMLIFPIVVVQLLNLSEHWTPWTAVGPGFTLAIPPEAAYNSGDLGQCRFGRGSLEMEK